MPPPQCELRQRGQPPGTGSTKPYACAAHRPILAVERGLSRRTGSHQALVQPAPQFEAERQGRTRRQPRLARQAPLVGQPQSISRAILFLGLLSFRFYAIRRAVIGWTDM